MAPFFRRCVAAAAVVAVWASMTTAAPPPRDQPKDVDLVICLDVSGSMNGLIDSARIKLWDVVNELAKMKPTPNLRVGLYTYGRADLVADGFVHKDVDLTTDLDEVYKKLNVRPPVGGTEYCGRVTKRALLDQKWSTDRNALRVIFVCGNEPADQDKEVLLPDAA
ncbi:MAG TPA: vWA domain-containing protein, partial [Fimbriiglobus sp.]